MRFLKYQEPNASRGQTPLQVLASKTTLYLDFTSEAYAKIRSYVTL